ncbi:hypothetical protein BC939DRAFT_410692 [Gamsiella multidivaricata]|uniref:uncharacterized protein n=1 Tax=Gamsiella multidivaricata TaxID=101098 RepID=UPI00221E5FF6|nr:uncharacterized protein BC939DRAFT_410692 [Gamsiella multidivaricata]KAI7824108.1 hypothetical protein BC939DRAFT_410692 [Gamsiella multidivaricata]
MPSDKNQHRNEHQHQQLEATSAAASSTNNDFHSDATHHNYSHSISSYDNDDPLQQSSFRPTSTIPSYLTRPAISASRHGIGLSLEYRETYQNLTVATDRLDTVNSAQWFYKPYLQPSFISTTATSSLMPTTALITPGSPDLRGCVAGTATPAPPMPSIVLPARARTPTPATLYSTLQSSLAAGAIMGNPGARPNGSDHTATIHGRTAGPYSSQASVQLGSFHLNAQPPLPIKDESIYHNPYKAPSHANSRAFVPPVVPGYEFTGGSQAGNMGLMMGKRLSDGIPVTGKLHQSRILLQHEYRILKTLKIANAHYIPDSDQHQQPATNDSIEQKESTLETDAVASSKGTERSHQYCTPKPGVKKAVYEAGSVETEMYFNRLVEDFIDLEHEDMSILILSRLGPNLLSHTHYQFMGMESTDNTSDPEIQAKRKYGSPFPDVRTFLIFALKAACILEALLKQKIAHLAICPTALHWMPSKADVGPWHSDEEMIRNADDNRGEVLLERSEPVCGPHILYSLLENMDINDTKLRLFDFTHSKILSHERARAPNNIVEWQIPGYLEYHLQFLAPEQTGRAETWMDHRTDIYGLGATLFSLLTMQYPNTGTDSVQILQGVLSRELPPLRIFRPDMPPVIDDILRKMTRKQPSQRYQNAFGFKQDILRCLNALHKTGRIDSFELGQHDVSYQFVLPNSIFGRHAEQQMISAAIAQAASACQQSLNGDMQDDDVDDDDDDDMASKMVAANNADYYVFEDDIVSLRSQVSAKIPLSSKTLLRTPKPFNRLQSAHHGPEKTDPIVRVVFVSGPSGVGKTMLIRGMATVARNSGLFAAGVFEAVGRAPYSAILSCIQSVLQQLLAQHTDALASLVVAILTAFEPNSGIGIICDLVPELRYFFNGSEMPEGKDVPLTHSIARFHALILKLIRVISTHFFMTWLIDDLQFADENSIDLLATLVNVNKRLPIVFIITHRDTPDCLMKVKHILGGGNIIGGRHPTGFSAFGAVQHDKWMEEMWSKGGPSTKPISKSSALRGTGISVAVRGGGGVRFIRLQNPAMETVQEFLGTLLHRDKSAVASLAKVLHQKSWLTIRQLALELYRKEHIYFNCVAREWEWESNPEKLAAVVRGLTGEEFAFLNSRFKALNCDTKRALVCASICGQSFTIQDLQQLILAVYNWTGGKCPSADAASGADPHLDGNKGCNTMAGIQSAIGEGILAYAPESGNLRFHHNIMRQVAANLMESPEQTERLHFEMIKMLFPKPGQELAIAHHILSCLNLIKKKLAEARYSGFSNMANTEGRMTEADATRALELDTKALRRILSRVGEKNQKSGSQGPALKYWNAALELLPDNCWDQLPETVTTPDYDVGMEDAESVLGSPATLRDGVQNLLTKQPPLYHETLRLHLQCIEAERWCENFDKAMKICETMLSKITDPIDRARVYQHQIEMSVWAYSLPAQATAVTIQCLFELGMDEDTLFDPTENETRVIFDKTHELLKEHMSELEADPPKVCNDPRIAMMMEVLSVAGSSLYYCNVPFMASGIVQSIKLICKHGITKDAGRALVTFALTYSTWYGRLDNVYELGRLACKVSNNSHHVRFLFYLVVQQWGEHVAHSIPALEETLAAVELACDRLFHTAGMIHVSVMKILVGRIHLNDLMSTTIELLTKHIEFGSKSHGVEVMQGILQMIKCLKGRTLAENPETIFEDVDFSETKNKVKKDKKALALVHNNSTYQMLKVLAAFIFGYYAFIQEVTDSWHDDPKSIMNFEGSWIAHTVFTVVGLAIVNLLRTETDPEVRSKYKRRLFRIHDQMEIRANKYPTNHAAMFYLLEAEIADQGLTQDDDVARNGGERATDMKAFLLYEKAIKFSVDGDFPLHKCFSYELAAKSHLRHGMVTSARCLLGNAIKVYQQWGAKGKVQRFYRTYPDMFPSPPEVDPAAAKRGLFYRPHDTHGHLSTSQLTSGANNNFAGPASAGPGGPNSTSPWAGSPRTIYSPTAFGSDAVSAAAAAMAESSMASAFQNGCPSATSTASSTLSAPLYSIQNTWLSSPQSSEADNADLDVLDFSSVIEAMQVIASEIDLDLLLVKSLGVLNQSVGAKRCCIIISKGEELVLAASQGDLGQCEPVNPPLEVEKCGSLFHSVINYVINTSTPCLLTNAKEDPRFCADEYLKQRVDLKTVLCAPILHKAALVGVLYMEEFPERAFANKRMLVMNLLVQQLGISITNALLYQSVLQSESKLNGLLENMPCGIALWDAVAENCQYVNSTWREMTGFTVKEIMNSRWRVLVHPDELISHGLSWKERVLAGVPCQWESRYGLKDGTFRWGIVRMLPIYASTDQNKILQWLTVTIDIDDQRRAVQLKSNFLANMSHELRTPFSGILGMLSLLRDSSGLSHEQFEFVDMAKASCEMLIRIVDDLLNFSKLEADKVTLEYIPLCFEEILGDVCDLLVPLASKKGLELIILVDDTLPVQLIGDPDRMKQILMNLIGNAIKFSTSGNVVIKYWHELRKRETLNSGKSSQSILEILAGKCGTDYLGKNGMEALRSKVELELNDSHLGDEVILHCSVTDQGIGMTPDEQKMLFVSFQQTDNGTTRKYGGTGLGLSICAQLIAHMHGKVVVESEKGKGSTFTFTAKLRAMTDHDRALNPVESARIYECEKVLTSRWAALDGKRVLILSPNKLLRQQVMSTAPSVICMEFDDVFSAVKCGAIGILGDPLSCCSDHVQNPVISEAAEDQMEGIIKGIGNKEGVEGESKCGCVEALPLLKLDAIPQFDFILVDHVLDSAELDCIYPSPSIAFVLLLAPTTETLRWILPPAQKRLDANSEETDSEQVDVGGRGRIRASSDLDFAEKAMGQVRSASFMSKIRAKSSASLKKPASGTPSGKRPRIPSQLFKRKKQSLLAATFTKRKEMNATVESTSGAGTEADTYADVPGSSPVPRKSSSFQVCRMIKPVRRLKLLQIMYNALLLHEHRMNGGTEALGCAKLGEIPGESEDSQFEDPGRSSPSSYAASSGTLSQSTSPSRSVSPQRDTLKRRRSKDDLAGRGRTSDEGSDRDLPPASKTSKTKALSSSSSSSSRARSRKVADGDLPKRARNNDALTLLLTPEQRKRCKGINVLVAEDDFVSQKILEKQLSKLGMNVVIAGNGQEAVDEWLAAKRGHYTIAIFDHHMPIMDGLAATKKIRALEADLVEEQKQKNEAGAADTEIGPSEDSSKSHIRIPIVGLSADIQLATKEKCIRAGMDEYMTKPLLTQGLALLIQRYCCH